MVLLIKNKDDWQNLKKKIAETFHEFCLKALETDNLQRQKAFCDLKKKLYGTKYSLSLTADCFIYEA